MTTIPTKEQLKDRVLNDLNTEFNVTATSNALMKSIFVALAKVWAGVLWLLYIALGEIQKNITWVTAYSVVYGGTLEIWGQGILGRYPFGAQAGVYVITVTGTAGGVIPATMVYKSNDDSLSPGKNYQVTGTYTLTGSGDTVSVRALEGGPASKLNIGDRLTATAPMINVNAVGVVDSETTTPVAAEDIEAYRSKISEKVLLEPGGWSAIDYRRVGLNIVGVGQTYAYGADATSVNVWLQGTVAVADPGPSVSGAIITAYSDALDLVRPATAYDINIASSPIKNVEVTITAGSFPVFTTAERALILSALTTFINGVQPFIAACDKVATRHDRLYTYNVSEVISRAVPGHGYSDVTFTVDGAPTTDWTADNGEIAFLNGITYA